MRVLAGMRVISETVKSIFRHFPLRSKFSCGDCERTDRCGLPPSDQCIIRAAQIERDCSNVKWQGVVTKSF